MYVQTSRSWNALAKAYLAKNPKLSSSLERVYISRGVPVNKYKGMDNFEHFPIFRTLLKA